MSSSFLHLLLLIIVANASPIIVRNLLGQRYARAIDGGIRFLDGRPLFGASKTWRGLVSAPLVTAIAAMLLSHPPLTGLAIGLLAMAGDLFSSFIKRRLGLAPSSMAPLLDQIPESLLPALVLADSFGLDGLHIILLVTGFIVFELSVSCILYQWGIRKRPY